MQSYKLVLVLKSSLSEAERKKFFETLKLWLKDLKIVKENEWGQKTLSYAIRKETSGFYIELVLEGDNRVDFDFEKKLKTADGVLRHVLLKN